MAINSRQKGKRIEREIATLFRPIFPDIQRNAAEQARDGGVDLLNTGCFDFEVKGGKQCNIAKVSKWLDQVQAEGSKENYKVVAVKPDRQDPYVIIPMSDFLELLEKMQAEGVI